MFDGDATRAYHGASASSAVKSLVVRAKAADTHEGEEPLMSASLAESLSTKAIRSRFTSSSRQDSYAIGMTTNSAWEIIWVFPSSFHESTAAGRKSAPKNSKRFDTGSNRTAPKDAPDSSAAASVQRRTGDRAFQNSGDAQGITGDAQGITPQSTRRNTNSHIP